MSCKNDLDSLIFTIEKYYLNSKGEEFTNNVSYIVEKRFLIVDFSKYPVF